MKRSKQDIRFILIGTVVAFLVSSIFHFAFELLGRPPLLAGLFPINESIWEHLKLPFYSLLIWIMVPQISYMKDVDICNKIVMITTSTFIAIIVVFFGYYGLKCGLNIESFKVDLLLLVIGLVLGLAHSVLYKYKEVSTAACILGVVYIWGMIAVFYYFSFDPPNLPGFI